MRMPSGANVERQPMADRSACVIGAGVAGLVAAKVLHRDGFDVTVFEKEATSGGVWCEARAYPGLCTNDPKEFYSYADYSRPRTDITSTT